MTLTMLDTQVLDRIRQHGICAIVVVVELVGDVSVDKDLSGFTTEHDGFRDTGVGT
jgi:hypothetical protein